MAKKEERFGLDTQIEGKDVVEYLADLIEKNDEQQVEVERCKLTVSIVKQMNNRIRLELDAAKFALKEQKAQWE